MNTIHFNKHYRIIKQSTKMTKQNKLIHISETFILSKNDKVTVLTPIHINVQTCWDKNGNCFQDKPSNVHEYSVIDQSTKETVTKIITNDINSVLSYLKQRFNPK